MTEATNEAVIAAEMEATSTALMDVLLGRMELAADASEKRGVLAGAAMATAEIFMALKTDTTSVEAVHAIFRNLMERAWEVQVATLTDEGRQAGASLN